MTGTYYVLLLCRANVSSGKNAKKARIRPYDILLLRAISVLFCCGCEDTSGCCANDNDRKEFYFSARLHMLKGRAVPEYTSRMQACVHSRSRVRGRLADARDQASLYAE